MTKRSPPALAFWLLMRLASDYQRDALIGDLTELYHQGASRSWYWRQVLAVLVVAGANALRAIFSVSAGKALLQVSAASVAIYGLISELYGWGCDSTATPFAHPTIIATIALVVAIVASRLHRPATKRFLAAFSVVTMSVATLTWAGTTTVHSSTQSICTQHP